MISAIVLLDSSGEIITMKTYRKEFDPIALDNYRLSVISPRDIVSPITWVDGTSFLHHFRNDIFYIAMTKQNANADVIFELITRLPDILSKVFGINEMVAKEARNRIPDIVELLDEMIDSGYPQNTDPEALRLLTGHSQSVVVSSSEQVTVMATGAIPWRASNIQYKSDEIYVDVVEKLSVLISSDNVILSNCVNGTTTMKALLSGMPDCTICFNDKISVISDRNNPSRVSGGIEVDDIVFHQCVRLNKFLSSREISFIPPDGEFELMRYRKTENVGLPFNITPYVRDLGGNKLEIVVSLESTYDAKLVSSHVELTIPLPQNTADVSINTIDRFKAKYDDEKNAVVWKLQNFSGKCTSEVTIQVQCLSASSKSSPATKLTEPISADFSIPKFSVSGLALHTIRTNLPKPVDLFIRYATRAGNYQIMMIPSSTRTQ